tara:strand:+ start:987 stop:1118 length:132 start_codon:yes stop_codon:yes gene_type:complete
MRLTTQIMIDRWQYAITTAIASEDGVNLLGVFGSVTTVATGSK